MVVVLSKKDNPYILHIANSDIQFETKHLTYKSGRMLQKFSKEILYGSFEEAW